MCVCECVCVCQCVCVPDSNGFPAEKGLLGSLFGRLFGLVGWLVGWLALVGVLVGRWVHVLVGWLVGRLVGDCRRSRSARRSVAAMGIDPLTAFFLKHGETVCHDPWLPHVLATLSEGLQTKCMTGCWRVKFSTGV